MSLTTKARDLFRMFWVKPAPITTRQAAAVLSKAASDQRTARERVHDRLRDECARGLVCGEPTR